MALAIGAGGCVSAAPEPRLPAGQSAPSLAELLDIKSALNLEEKTIILATSAPVKFTSYMLDGPPRLAVEMRQTASMIPSAPIMVDDSLVDKISVHEFKKAGAVRVEIGLKKGAKSAVMTTDGGVEIKLFPAEPSQDPAALAVRLMETEARMATMASENEELKGELDQLSARLRQYEGQADDSTGKETPIPQAPATGAKAGVLALMEQWRGAWENGNFAVYSALYSPAFAAGGLTQAQWLEKAKPMFDGPDHPKVRLYHREIRIRGGGAKVRFTAESIRGRGPGAWRETTRKALTLAWSEAGEWKIESEETGPAR